MALLLKIIAAFRPLRSDYQPADVVAYSWGTFLVSTFTLTWVAWAMGLGATLGLGQGVARAEKTNENRVAIQELQTVVKCGALANSINANEAQLYAVQRQIDMDQPQPRQLDVERAQQLRRVLAIENSRFEGLGCAMVLAR